MNDKTLEADADRFAALAEKKRRLKEVSEEGEESAGLISEAFQTAGRDISDALETAARTGELSFQAMAEQITQSLASLLIDRYLVEPLNSLADGLGPSLGDFVSNILGQRAEGGPVGAGSAYLVGERGPEVFIPGQAGSISPIAPAGPVNVTIYAGADAAESVRRSERQIAAAVARAALAGRSSL
ncbi:MAG: phage tail tape measure C-terminal domain-containing protein [Oceanicaulis sp.]